MSIYFDVKNYVWQSYFDYYKQLYKPRRFEWLFASDDFLIDLRLSVYFLKCRIPFPSYVNSWGLLQVASALYRIGGCMYWCVTDLHHLKGMWHIFWPLNENCYVNVTCHYHGTIPMSQRVLNIIKHSHVKQNYVLLCCE